MQGDLGTEESVVMAACEGYIRVCRCCRCFALFSVYISSSHTFECQDLEHEVALIYWVRFLVYWTEMDRFQSLWYIIVEVIIKEMLLFFL